MAQALRGQVSLSRRKGHRRAAATVPSRADLKSGLPRAPPSPWRAPGRPWGQEVGLDGGRGAAAPPGWASISLLPPPPRGGPGKPRPPRAKFPEAGEPGREAPRRLTRFYSGLSQGHSSNTARPPERGSEREREGAGEPGVLRAAPGAHLRTSGRAGERRLRPWGGAAPEAGGRGDSRWARRGASASRRRRGRWAAAGRRRRGPAAHSFALRLRAPLRRG